MTDLQRSTEASAPDPVPGPTGGADRGDTGEPGAMSRFFGDLTADLSALVRKEIELALAETKSELMQAAKAGGMLGGGALSGYFALLFASLALAWMFDGRMRRWLAFGLVAALHGTVAGALLARGREEMLQVDPVPRQTVESLKDDVDAIRGNG